MTKKPLNIILVGKTGCGKSSTGNFIVGKKVFKPEGGLKSTTKEISVEETVHDGRTIKVSDTPGLFDTDENLFETALKIQTSLKEVSPGPHAFLIVIHGSRKYTKEEKLTQHIIQLTFGVKVLKHALIILTHEDQHDSSEKLLREAESVPELQTLIKLCGGRCITLNSLCTDRVYSTGKIKNIINEVNAISKNGDDCYKENLTAYTEALKEHANKKTANEDLTVDLLATYLTNADEKTKKEVDAAYSMGEAKGMGLGVVAGSAITVAAGVCMVGLGVVKLQRFVSENREPSLNALRIGFEFASTIVEAKRECDNQDMHSRQIDWRSEQLRVQQCLDKLQFNGK